MIQLIDEDDVKKKKVRHVKNVECITNSIQLIGKDDVIDESKVHKMDEKEKIIIKKNASKNKKYHLLRWKIKRFLIQENIIKKCVNWGTILDVFDSELIGRDDFTDLELKKIFSRHSFKLVEHHTKYIEIHGIDESLWMTPSEHRNLHNRLREEGKCNVPPEELEKISKAAVERTEKHIIRKREYVKTNKYKEYKHEYNKKSYWFMFKDTIAPNIRLQEEIVYSSITGNLVISSGFVGDHGKKLLIIDID